MKKREASSVSIWFPTRMAATIIAAPPPQCFPRGVTWVEQWVPKAPDYGYMPIDFSWHYSVSFPIIMTSYFRLNTQYKHSNQ